MISNAELNTRQWFFKNNLLGALNKLIFAKGPQEN